MPDFILPDLGEGVTEAEIGRWFVAEGDRIAEDDPLVEVITDKATAEIPSPFAGVVTRIHAREGEVVPVGTALVTIGDAGAEMPSSQVEAPEPSAAPAAEGAAAAGPVKALPPVRRLAAELGVDLARVQGTGPGGRILREDVEAFAARAGAAVGTGQPESAERREPLRGIRRIIAERMAEAHRAIPAVTHVEECDVTELDATRRTLTERHPEGPKLTYLPFLVKAAVAALEQYPALNASLDEEAGEIVYHGNRDIGIAVDTPAGLMVPVLRRAEEKDLFTVAAEIEELGEAARAGTLAGEQLRGATFTISSPGAYAGIMATPIVTLPQVAILGVHRATDRPVVRDDQIVVRKVMNLSITFDHRVLDGMTAARFLLEVVRLLEHPELLDFEG